MKLSKRLESIINFVDNNAVVADIGCDHGLLAIELINRNIAKHVYACDVRRGPLQRAIENIQQYQLQKSITSCLQDGLNGLTNDVDTVVIAGMGFHTIKQIIEQNFDFAKKLHKIIVQSNTKNDHLRQWIQNSNGRIIAEDLVFDDLYYEIVCFDFHSHDQMSDKEFLFGKYLYDHSLFKDYWNHRLKSYESIIKNIDINNSRRLEIFQICELIKSQLEL